MPSFDAEVWLAEADGAWHFVTLPVELSHEIADRTGGRGPRPGFGSVRVRVTIGSTTWATSVFPDSKRGAYVLPVKKEVRRREGITAGDVVTVGLAVTDARGST